MHDTNRAALRPQKTAVLVAQRIVADIERTGKTVGDRLPPEKAMLAEYQVGRGTLRESLRFLEIQGLISLKPGPGGGPVVEQPSGAGLAITLALLLQFDHAPYRDITEARRALEPLMAELAATRMTGEQLAALRDNVTRTQASIGNEAEFLAINQEFHDIIANGSGNSLFHYLIDAMTGILDGSIVGIGYPEVGQTAIQQAHERILLALEARDGRAAAEAMSAHIDEYDRYIDKRFPELKLAPIAWL